MALFNSAVSEEVKIAALSGFLEGISYLNKDRRSNFAEAFCFKATSEAELCSEIAAAFPQLTNLSLSGDEGFQGGFNQLEQDIKTLILPNPDLVDETRNNDLRSYLSFKILDRLDDICELGKMKRPRKIVGALGAEKSPMTFYWMVAPTVTVVLYFYNV